MQNVNKSVNSLQLNRVSFSNSTVEAFSEDRFALTGEYFDGYLASAKSLE